MFKKPGEWVRIQMLCGTIRPKLLLVNKFARIRNFLQFSKMTLLRLDLNKLKPSICSVIQPVVSIYHLLIKLNVSQIIHSLVMPSSKQISILQETKLRLISRRRNGALVMPLDQ